MKTAKVLNLGAALLLSVVWLTGSVRADDGAATVSEAPSAAEVPAAEVPAAEVPAAEAPAAEAPAATETAAVAPAEADAQVETEMPAEVVDVAEAGETLPEGEETAVAEVPAPHQVELGAIGYDSAGRRGRIHLVVVGDTLWDISDAYLGTPWVWPSIWQDNQEIENPHLIHPGDRIWITPSEMRRISGSEADALLAGQPASADEEPELDLAFEPEVEAEKPPDYSVPDREVVGLLEIEQIEAAGTIVSAVQDKMMLSHMDHIYISRGEGETEIGDQYTIFQTKEKVYDPETGDLLGYHVEFHGWAEVVELGEESSRAEIKLSVTDIRVGDKIIERPPAISKISLQPGPDVEGSVSFLPHNRTMMASADYVYLNRGTLDGLEIGSPLVVYRPGYAAYDSLRGGDVRVEDRIVADLIVVRVRDESSVALVRHTEETLAEGDHFRGAR
ncbi:MAG: LysM peptidoglycan-binding domain-containing protein [Deltaproteobacteria bacterium]|nr:MAG: LysM peptidoglycan-binding domain-containing protein [Deltaproteobacteria bacterium]